MQGAKFASEYRLDSSKIDVALARALYQNVDPRYKLGAGFARPAINVPVGFMGAPMLTAKAGGEAQDALDRVTQTWNGTVLQSHRALLRDGSILLRVFPGHRSPAYASLWAGEPDTVELGYELAEAFEVETLDEDIGAITGFRVKHVTMVRMSDGHYQEKALYETVYPDRFVWEWEDNYRPKQEYANPLGFVPAVFLKNDGEEFELNGRSELEPLEPYLRFYNDVMLHAGAASKLHSTAKLTLRVKDVNQFLTNNFTQAEIDDGRLRFNNKDILFFETGVPDIGVSGGSMFQEGADIIQARAPLGDTNTLLEYIFLNIVDVSEVPEWAYGGAIASSKASVSEQSAPLIHKVGRKRTHVENSWALIGRMALAMLDIKSAVTCSWDDLQQKDTKNENEAIKLLADAVISLVDAEIISKHAAVEQLRPFFPDLLEYKVDDEGDDELTRIEGERDDNPQEAAAALAQLLSGGNGSQQEVQNDRNAGLRALG